MSFKVFAFSAGRENVHAVLFISVMHSPLSSFCFNYTEKDAKKSPANCKKVAKLRGDGCLNLVFGSRGGAAAVRENFVRIILEIQLTGEVSIIKQS